MNLKYIGKFKPERISFWDIKNIRYDFTIFTKDNEEKMMDIFEKEFKFNCRNQLNE